MPRQRFDVSPPPKFLLLFFGGYFFFAFGVFATNAIMSGDIPLAIIDMLTGAVIIVYLVLSFTNRAFLRIPTFVTLSPVLLLYLGLMIWEFFHGIH